MMTQKTQEKLARVLELLTQMDAIHAEMEGLLGGGAAPLPLTVRDKVKDVSIKQTSKDTGKRGVQMERILAMIDKGMKPRDIAEKIGCSTQTVYNAKNKSYRYRKPVVSGAESEAGMPLTEDQWKDAKESQKMEISSGDVAESLGVAMREVNKAFMTSNYQGYLKARKHD